MVEYEANRTIGRPGDAGSLYSGRLLLTEDVNPFRRGMLL